MREIWNEQKIYRTRARRGCERMKYDQRHGWKKGEGEREREEEDVH